MIKKYYQSKTRSISPQTVDDQEKIDKDTEKTDKEKINTDKLRSWPRVVLKKTILEKVTKRLNASKKANEESEMETSIEAEGASKVGTRQHYIRHTTYEEEEAESEVDQIPVEESSEDEVDMRDLNEVRPKEPPTLRMKSNAPPPRRRPDRRSRKRRKKNCYFKPGNLHFTKRAGFVSAKDRERQEKQAEENERAGEEDTTMAGVKLPPVERPKTRSLTRSDDGLASDHDMIEVTSNSPGKKRIRLSRYEAWKIIGLDPNSEPPWPCTHPSCGYYFASLNSILTHHAWKHDTFGDRNQRKLARSLGEKYSLFAKREKRAVDGAKIDDDDENADGEAGVVKSKRKKKPVKRLTNVLIGKNKHFIPKYEQRTEVIPKRKKLRCKYCQRYFISQINLRTHMRRMHKTKWMKDNNLTQEDMDEITKSVAENEDASSANISLLATVADKLDDKVNLICKTCSFKAVSERALGHHMNQAHPDYIRSIYSDSDEDKVADDDADKQTPDVTPSNRPVRKCRRKSLPKIMQKEKKLDMVIPKILPHHAIYGQALPEEEAGEKEDEDDDGEDGGDELPRSGISLQCEECNYIAMSDRNFVSHMKTVHKQDVVLNYQCDQCDFSGTGRELFVHKKSHVPTVMCDMCGKTLKGDKRLKMHQMYHCGNEKKPKRYSNKVSRTCKICHKEFNNLATFRYHMTGHRNDERGETFSCDICQKTFTRKQSVRMHKTIAHMEKKFQCLHCPFKGAYKTQFRYHLWEKHDIGGETMPDLKCDFEGCTFSTKKRKQLTGHKRKHDMTRFKYWCDGCNQPIRTLTCLAKHQVLHRDGVTKYKCKECGYQATDSNTLSSHKQWKHADPSQTIICDLCGASFTRAADHNLHRKLKHTELEPVKCKGCELTFKFTYQMTKHMKVEHRDLIEAEEAAQMEEAKKIINAVPKRRTKSVEKKKRVKKKKPPTGKKVGRPKAALTPELVAKREEQKRERNKRKYENRKAKMKQLGLKRKKYPKKRGGQTSRTLMQPRKQRANAVSTAGTNEDYSDEEVATAAQQLESIAQAFTTQPQTVSPYKSTSNNYPVQVEPTDHHAYAQLTALNCEFNVGASTSSAGTLHIHPPVTTQEVVVPTDVIVGSNAEQQVETTSTTQRIVPAPSSGEMLAEGRQGEQPVSYLEVTTVHSDGRRHVEMWPVWQDP
ncbi:uncharacterized protein [Amphiura filiformis]|uniref:uncharacterized protein n=1 Tax=Amphiura filiformis TaxID=82378 RepID=UPI003B215A8F